MRTLPLAALAVVIIGTSGGCTKDRGVVPTESKTTTRSADASGAPDGATCGPRSLPESAHFVADGLCTRVVAVQQGRLRGIVFAANGDLIGIRHDGEIRRYRDVDEDGLFAPSAPETIVWARTNSDNGHNCAFDGEDLYCGAKGSVKRWHYVPTSEHGGDGETVVVAAPEGGRHPTLNVGVWDGFLYVASGSKDNAMDRMPAGYPTDRAVVRRFPLARYAPGKPLRWQDGEVFARGVRNLTAMARAPNGHIIGVDQGVDELHHRGNDIHDDNPGEAVLRLEAGKAYGFPFCFYAQRLIRKGAVVPPGAALASEIGIEVPVVKDVVPTTKSNKSDAWCARNAAPPLSLIQAHSSVLSLAFVPRDAKDALPARWRGGAFAALHGSWNRKPSTGHKVVFLPFDENGSLPMPRSDGLTTQFPYEVVFGGGRKGEPKDGEWSWKMGDIGEDPVRPVGVALSPVDGALYVSSDNNVFLDPANKKEGAIYRIAAPGR